MAVPISERTGVVIAMQPADAATGVTNRHEETHTGSKTGTVTWAIITGEYPPQIGGVSDYTHLVAHGLADFGDEVHVWAPACSAPALKEGGVHLHRLTGHFGVTALSQLSAELKSLPPSCRLLVQYVPHAFGWKAINVAFCLWLVAWKRQPVWLVYHEVAFPLRWKQPLKHTFLAVITHAMASLLARTSDRVYISVPAWASLLPRRVCPTWLPIPSTIPVTVSQDAVRQVRLRYAPHARQLIGHFGTFGPTFVPLLHDIAPGLLRDRPDRILLLLGKTSDLFRKELIARHPQLSSQVIATGILPGDEIATHLAACDVLIQPYPDGVSTRRSTMMAGSALGMPIITNKGPVTEPLWAESDAAALAAGLSADAFIRETEALLADPIRLAQLRYNAATLYKQRFAIANTLRELRS